jgi:hypothetical protein
MKSLFKLLVILSILYSQLSFAVQNEGCFYNDKRYTEGAEIKHVSGVIKICVAVRVTEPPFGYKYIWKDKKST